LDELPVEAKKWMLNKRNRQQQEYDSRKRSSSSGTMATNRISDRDKNNSNTPNQYANAENSVKGE
jgi:hypothetical protein